MRQIFLFLFLFIFCHSFSQNISVSGTVYDTISKKGIKNAVAIAVRLKDSILIAHTRTNSNGYFKFQNLPVDTFQVLISDSRFADKSFYIFGSKNNSNFDFGKIILPNKSEQLSEIVIYAYKDPVYYKGDTLIYTADSFKVKPNATVEDLLKKLPGIKVDMAGKITAQGKEISQVLVDGDEFFGSDPTIATKNLAANGVESVQVYEKKNDNPKDGEAETTQVMNLKLKEAAKKGYFGKVSGSTDIKNFYEGEVLANRFKNAQKISVFMLASNTPRSSFGWGDSYKYGLDNEMNRNFDENFDFKNANKNQNKGIPQTLKYGFYYTDKIGKKSKLSANYTYSSNELNVLDSTKSQYFLSDTNYVTNNTSQNFSKSESRSLNFKFTQPLDSLTELIVEPKFQLNNLAQNNSQVNDFLTSNESLVRQTNVNNLNESKGSKVETNVTLNRKFKKKNRLFQLNYNFVLNDNNAEGVLKSYNFFYDSTVVNDSINQKKINTSNTRTNIAKAVFTEPLTNKIKLEFEYYLNHNIISQNKKSLDFENEDYQVFNSTLSNDFETKNLTNRIGITFIHETKKQSIDIGARLRNVDIVNANLINNQIINQSVNNVLPFLKYKYRFGQSTRFYFTYSTASILPSVNQLQPIPDNSNPNQIILGNPNLLPTFSNNFNISYNDYKPITKKNLWLNANLSATNNAFANSTLYDSIGRTITQTLNVKGNSNMSVSMGFDSPLISKILSINNKLSSGYNRYASFINGEKNSTLNRNIKAGTGLTLELDTLTFSIGYEYNYNSPISSLNSASNKPYSEQHFDANIKLKLPYKILLESDADYVINSQRAPGYNLNYVVWNASVGKAFLKNENLILTFSGNDILNQNISNTRTVQGNIITDNKTKIISRYFLVKLTYKFNSNNTKENDNYF